MKVVRRSPSASAATAFSIVVLGLALLVTVEPGPARGGSPTTSANDPTAHSAGKLPKMVGPEAKRNVKSSLRAKFGSAYIHGSAKRIGCKRLSRTRMRCKVKWFIGDVSYKGQVATWFGRKRGAIWWFTKGKVKRLNEYCVVEGGTKQQCTKTIKWG